MFQSPRTSWDHFQHKLHPISSHFSKFIEVLVDRSRMAQQVLPTKLALIQPIQLRLKTATSKFQPVQESRDRKRQIYDICVGFKKRDMAPHDLATQLDVTGQY